MAAPTLLPLPQYVYPQNADLSQQLTLLGDTVAKTTQAHRRNSLLTDAMDADGKLDFDKALVGLLQIGDTGGASALANYRNAQTAANSVYGTPIYGTDEQGNTRIGTFDKGGTFRPINTPGFTPTPGVKMLDTGTGFVPVSNRSGQPVQGQTYQPGQPPAAPGAPPPQTGYIPKDVAGKEREEGVGQAQAKLITGKNQAESTLRDLDTQWKLVDDTITDVLKKTDWTNVGTLGAFTSRFPGSPAYNLARTLDTIKANIGFDKLQSMRDNSPTGGALGQVSEFENRLLQSVRGSTDQGQTPTQFKANLERIQTDLKALQQERRRSFQQTYSGIPSVPRPPSGQSQSQPGMPQMPKVNEERDGYRFKGGNPADPASWVKLR